MKRKINRFVKHIFLIFTVFVASHTITLLLLISRLQVASQSTLLTYRSHVLLQYKDYLGNNNLYAQIVNASMRYDTWIQFSALIVFVIFIISICVLCIDSITKKRMKEERDYLEHVINTISTPIFIIDDEHNLRNVNNAACNIFKKDRIDLIGHPCSSIGSANCMTHECAIQKLIHDGIDKTFMKIDQRQYIVTTTYLKNIKNTKRSGYIEVMQDVTNLMNMQKTLEERTLELETISLNLVCGILLTSLTPGFSIIQCNQGYLDLVGYREAEVIGEKAINWVYAKDMEMTETRINEQLEKGEEVRLEHRLIRKDGSLIWVSLYGKQTELHGQEIGIWMIINIDDRKKTEEQLIMNEERYRIAAHSSENIIVDFDVESQRLIMSDKVYDIYGLHDVMLLQDILDFGVIDESGRVAFQSVFKDIMDGKQNASCEFLTNAINGKIWVRLSFTSIFNKEGNVMHAIGIWHDFTAEKNILLQYQREAQYRKITMDDTELYYEVDLTHNVFVTGHEDLVKNYADTYTNDFDVVVQLMVRHIVYASDRELVNSCINHAHLMHAYEIGKAKIDFEYRRMLTNATYGWVGCTIYVFCDEISNDIKALGYIRDIDQMKKMELSLKQQAERDLLTGLYNKITTQSLIEKNLEKQEHTFKALMIVDLDNFKQINDSKGHVFGDTVLSGVSNNLHTIFNDRNILGRIGGDEFLIYVKTAKSIDEAKQLAKQVCEIFHKENALSEVCNISVSIGISCIPDDGTSFEDLYRKADIALYASKNSGKDMYSFYNASLPQIGSGCMRRNMYVEDQVVTSEGVVERSIQLLYHIPKLHDALEAIFKLVTNHFGYDQASVIRYDSQTACWRKMYTWHMKDDTFSQDLMCINQKDYMIYFDKKGIAVLHQDIKKDVRVQEIMDAIGIYTSVQIAFIQDGLIHGFIAFDDCTSKRTPDDHELDTLYIITMLLAGHLQHVP